MRKMRDELEDEEDEVIPRVSHIVTTRTGRTVKPTNNTSFCGCYFKIKSKTLPIIDLV